MYIDLIFQELARDNSRLFKIDYLRKHATDPVLIKAVKLALDPFTQFYIRKIPGYEEGSKDIIQLDAALDMLKDLSDRKVTGHAAIDYLTTILESLHPLDAEVIKRVISKDLKCGVSIATVNEIWPGLIHEYPCMLCSAYDEKLVDKISFPALAQLKMDGMRFNAIVRSDEVEFRSRNGKEIELLGFLEDEFKAIAGGVDVVFDGELIVVKNGKILDRQTGNGILNKANKGTIGPEEACHVQATVWDVIPYEYFMEGKYPTPYSTRLSYLEKGLHNTLSTKVKLVEYLEVADLKQAYQVFNDYYANGQEGIILKDLNGIWENKRSKTQIKFKGELECDLLITGIEEGNGKYKGKVGALICESADGILKVNVGSGLNDQHRKNFTAENIVGKVVSIKYNARIKNKDGDDSLFLPVFVEIREDKDKADSAGDIK